MLPRAADFIEVLDKDLSAANDAGGVERSWAAIVLDKRSCFVLANDMLGGELTPEALWNHVVRSMAGPGPRLPRNYCGRSHSLKP